MTRTLFVTLLLFSVYLFSASTSLSAQDRINISGGFGILDLLHVGVRVQHKQIQLGISTGYLRIGVTNIHSYSLDTYWHFAGKTKYSTRRPWYWKNGIGLYHTIGPKNRVNNTYFNSRIGIELYDSEKTGVQFELGAGYLLRSKKEGTFSSIISIDLPDLVPGIAIVFFFRIPKKSRIDKK